MATNEQTETLPLARMASINNPWFWIYAGVFTCIYLYEKIAGANPPDSLIYIVGCVFIALFLTLVTQAIKHRLAHRVFNIITYAFEMVSLLFLVLSILFRFDPKG